MTELKKELGLFTCIMLVIGNIIGVGIFTTPGEIAAGLPSAGWVLVAWLIGGLMATVGALTYAELGTMFPKAGGNYVFLKEAYGPIWGFLYGWAYSLVTSPGTIALLAIGFGEYLGLQTGTWVSKGFAIVVVLVLTLINAAGVQMGARITNSITSLKVGAMVILVSFGFLLGQGIPGHFSPFLTGQVSGSLVAIGAALVPMAFTYSGWNSTVIVAEEVKDPNRFIPLSLLIGTLATTFIYVLMNAVYLYALPLGKIVGEETVAHLAAVQLFGPRAGTFIQLLVAVSVLGCLSASLLTNPRTTFALGRDGLFFRFTGKVHPVYFTPSGAILFQGLWACVLILWGRFDQLLILVSVPLVIISAMTVLSLFVFRKKSPDHPRPYRCWGYPIVPFLYVLVSLGMLYVKFVQKTQTNILLWPFGWSVPASYCGLAIFVLGVPVFFLWKKYYRVRL